MIFISVVNLVSLEELIVFIPLLIPIEAITISNIIVITKLIKVIPELFFFILYPPFLELITCLLNKNWLG